MGNLRIAITVFGLLTVLPALALAKAPASTNTKTTVHATKGIVTFVDANTLVITRTPHDNRETTFVLNASTLRSGDVKVGSAVDIRYRIEADRRIVTAVAVVPGKLRRA